MNLDLLPLVLIPLHIVLLPPILLYEITIISFDERFDNPSQTRNFLHEAYFFLSLPWYLLPEMGSFGHRFQSTVRRVQRFAWRSFFLIVWRPLFGIVVPAILGRANSRVYNSLPALGRNTIRLLEIHPGSGSDDIVLGIKHVALGDSRLSYEALSYTWGPSLVLRRVVQANRHTFLITDGAYRALKELRETDRSRMLWIDSICINQNDNAEKNEQVKAMHEIYSRATRVIVWLGSAPKDLEEAFCVAQNGKLALGGPHMRAIQSLLRRRWWSRIWVVQEVALARDVIFRIGHIKISWAMLSSCIQHLSSQYPFAGYDTRVLDFINSVTDIQTEPVGLLELAIRYRKRIATDPRDKIFGLGALTRSSVQGQVIKPDYSMSATQVFASFAAMRAIASQSIAPIVLSESRPVAGLSWAADWYDMTDRNWSTSDLFHVHHIRGEKRDCVPLWSDGLLPSIDARVRYNSAGPLSKPCTVGSPGSLLLAELNWPSKPIEWFPDQGISGWRSLYLTGWVVDSISISGSTTQSLSETSFLKMLDSWRTVADTYWRDIWNLSNRIMVEDTFFANANPILDAIELRSRRRFFEEAKTLSMHRPFNPDSELKTVEEVFSLLVACCFGRRFFISAGGRLGLAPAKSRTGDLVCMLAGSPVPCVLRRKKKASLEQYEYIGQAYLHGAMEYAGDLLEDVRSGAVKLERFIVS